MERVAAAMGALQAAPIIFEPARDIPQWGKFLALSALQAVGLLRYSPELYALPKGSYGLSSVLMLLAMMALARLGSIEQLRYAAAGEWGNLLGLDRVPEVRTLRGKLKLLCAETGRAARWNAALAKEWISHNESEQESGLAFYVHGQRKATPRHISVQGLPEADRFMRLRTEGKYFLHTVKMMRIVGQTSVASTVREQMNRTDDSRALLRQIYNTEVNLIRIRQPGH